MISFFNNLLDLVVMLELGGIFFFYCQSKAKPRVLMSRFCNLMLLDIKRFRLIYTCSFYLFVKKKNLIDFRSFILFFLNTKG